VTSTGDKQARAEQIAHELQGTCNSYPEELEEDLELAEMVEEHVFLCAQCGWWCEQSEANEGPDGEDVCDDCAGE
jgi:rubrerythrin